MRLVFYVIFFSFYHVKVIGKDFFFSFSLFFHRDEGTFVTVVILTCCVSSTIISFFFFFVF